MMRRSNKNKQKISGTPERPRLSVHKSLNHIYVQLVDDQAGKTIAACSTLVAKGKGKKFSGGNVEAAKMVGKAIAEKAIGLGVKKVVFDRGGFRYHGRVKALADAAREGGLQF